MVRSGDFLRGPFFLRKKGHESIDSLYTLREFALVPAMGVAYCDEGFEYVVPGLRRRHHGVGEHAAVPADVLVGAGRYTMPVAHPEACDLDDVHLAIGIVRRAVAAGLIV